MKKQETRATALKLVGCPEAFASTMEAYISALNHPRDWKFKDAGTLSLNTLEGRKPVAFVCGKHQRAYLDEARAGTEGDWKIRSGRLIRRKNGDCYFNIAMTKEFEVGGLEDRATVIGVDLGINNIAVAYTTAVLDIIIEHFYELGKPRSAFLPHIKEGASGRHLGESRYTCYSGV